MKEILEKFKNENIEEIYIDELMKNHTTFKIGGPADILITVRSEDDIVNAVTICREHDIDYIIIGNGSNLLVKDGGIRGVVIKINESYSDIKVDDKKVYCESGALLTAVSRRCMKESLTGFEFANGIPGTIGGAATMNAGAYGGELRDAVSMVRVLDCNNKIKEYSNEEMNFRYRNSRVQDEKLIVLGVELTLEEGNFEEIKKQMKELTFKRKSKQPIELPSSGSTFKRPEGYFAAKLIEDSGLKGLKHRGAQVSEKHSGFVVNIDNATCKDVLHLIGMIQATVKNKFNVDLEREVMIVGED